MDHATSIERMYIIRQSVSQAKKDLRSRFGDLLEEFKRDEVNGSIQLHFSHGYLAKIHSTRVD